MNHSNYSFTEILLFGYALGLSVILLFFEETREVAAMPPFLAWLMLNRRART